MGRGFTPGGLGLSNSNVSLGGVGGPRGVGAGGLRYLIEFVTAYRRGDFKNLEADLAALKTQSIATQRDIQTQLTKRIALEQNIYKAQQSQVLLGKVSTENLKQYTDLQTRALAENAVNGKVSADTVGALLAAQQKFISEAVTSKELTADQAHNLLRQLEYSNQLIVTNERLVALGQAQLGLQGEITDKERIKSTIKDIGTSLKGLAIGSIGAVIGGEILNDLFFKPLQAGIDSIKTHVGEALDPMEAARKAAGELGEAVAAIASSKNISSLEAAKQLITDISKISALRPGTDPGLAAAEAERLALDKQINPVLQQQIDFLKTGRQASAETRDLTRDQLVALSGVTNAYDPIVQILGVLNGPTGIAGVLAGQQALNSAAMGEIPILEQQARENENNLLLEKQRADAAAALADYLQEAAGVQIDAHLTQTAATINSFSDIALGRLKASVDSDIAAIHTQYQGAVDQAQADANARIRSLQERSQNLGGPSARTESLQKQLAALNDVGPSRRTRELADQLERINRATEKQAYLSNLAAVAEQKHLLLLKQRLEASQTDIDLGRYHGQARLVAIQAELDLMSRRNAEQQRFNRLLDIQYAISKGVQRAQGESITDFIGRRAVFYRDQLQQAADINNQTVSAALNVEKQRVENEVALRDLAEKRKKIIADRAHQLLLRRLQNELNASKQADQDALDARRKQLQAALDASRKADAAALDSQRRAIAAQIDAIRTATDNHIAQLNRERDSAIAARQKQYEFDVAKEKAATDFQLEQAQKRADAAKQWANTSVADQKAIAIAGAKDLATINGIAGQAAGSEFAYEQLKAELQAYGLSDAELAVALANVAKVRDAAQQWLKVYGHPVGGDFNAGHAKGGFFDVTNAMNFGKNIRAGEEGTELGWSDGRLGAILPHKLAESLKGAMSGGPMIGGGVTINRSDDPYRDYHRLKRTVTDIVDQRLAAR